MTAFLLTLGLFAAWWAIGLALLSAVRVDTRDLRLALVAPAVGSAVAVVPLFVVSNLGIPLETGALPVCITLAVATLIALAIRRPRLTLTVAPVLVVCLVYLVVVGRPMFRYGFNWIANANSDMGYYVLSATSLLHRGLLSPVDKAGLLNHSDFASTAQALHHAGIRAGTDLMLSALSAISGLSVTALYMPLALSLSLCGICAVGALAMQTATRWWGATVAAVLIAASPLAAYGLLQQLTPQVWGLALAAALAALLMRPEIHGGQLRANLPQYVAIWFLAIGLFVVYIELAVSLSVAYGLYVLLLAVRRKVVLRTVSVLWTVTIALSALVFNTFIPPALHYVNSGVHGGITGHGGVGIFGYSLVPSALPGITGFQKLSLAPSATNASLWITLAVLCLAAVVIACVVTAFKGRAASIIVACDFGLGLVLAYNRSDFGLFKLYMYAQPFLAAAIAVFVTNIRNRRVLWLVGGLLIAVIAVQLRVQKQYVDASFSPIDLTHASDSDLLPVFRAALRSRDQPIVTSTDNFTLAWLEGASAGSNRRLYFLGRRSFDGLPSRSYRFLNIRGQPDDIPFFADPVTVHTLSRGHCTVVMSTGSQVAVNRRVLPEGSPDLVPMDCAKARNLLVFTASKQGQPFSLPDDVRSVSFWQLEPDSSFTGHTLSGFGRYALFTVLGPTPAVRLALDFTTSNTGAPDGSYRLPNASVVGTTREPLPVLGTGSARVISPPLRPQVIDGLPYILLDMGEKGAFTPVPRPGLTGLWGKSVLLDPRALTSSVRDVSLISAAQYRKMKAPDALRSFPADLGDLSLEYSGIFEDGWVGARSYARLSSERSETLVVRFQALPRPGQHLDVLLDGKKVASREVAGGETTVRLHVPASNVARRVELRFAEVVPLRAPDQRSAAAHLQFLGFATPPSTLRVPNGLSDPALDYSGVHKDGWLERHAQVTLAGGGQADLRLDAEVATNGQHLEVEVNGKTVDSQPIASGALRLRLPISASRGPRTIRLTFAKDEVIAANDSRRAAALLHMIAIAPRSP